MIDPVPRPDPPDDRPADAAHVGPQPRPEQTVVASEDPPPLPPTVLDFLSGDSEMGRLTRAFDWSQTPVGPIEQWPQSLRTIVTTLLTSRYPMFLWWGPELIQFYNDGYRPSLGSTKHPQALGQPGRDCWPEIWPIIGPQIEAVMERGESTWNEDHLVPINRNDRLEEVYWTYSYSPIRKEDGEVGGVLVVVTETTGRVVGERRLRLLGELASATRAAQTAEEACAAATRVLADTPNDLPFALLYLLDPAAHQMTLVGHTLPQPDPAVAPPQVSLTTLPGDTQATWPFAEAITTGQAQHLQDVEARLGTLAGTPWPEPVQEAVILPIAQQGQAQPAGLLVAGISPRRPLDDEYQGFLKLVADRIASAVADARAYEQEHQRAEALATLDRAKTTFFSNVSHEFRTPLTLLLGPLQDLLTARALPPQEQRDRLEIIHRNALRLLKMVNSLLDFSRIEAGRHRAVYRPTDLATLTADLASLFRSAIEQAGVRFEVHTPPLREPVFVDREMWEKIVINLLSNAFKFTWAGEIEVRLQHEGGAAVLSVRDTGTGIPAAEVPHLFERFHRVESARGRTYEGTGIGLALVRELAALQGGSVQVTSVEGEGSTFTVTLPLGTAHLDAAQIEWDPAPPGTPEGVTPYLEETRHWLPDPAPPHADLLLSPPATGEAMPGSQVPTQHRGARILLADDNADMRNYLTRLLQQHHYQVDAVSTGLAAWEAARRDPPDLVLSDVMMPEMDGFGLLEALRADPNLREVPVILLSARAGEEAHIEGLEAGADAYLSKPFSARELLAHVGTQLEMAYLRRSTQEKLTRLFMQAPVAISVLTGPPFVFELANPRYVAMVEREVVGKPIREAFPELPADAPVFQILEQVYATGEGFTADEYRVLVDRHGAGHPEDLYFQFTCQPIRDATGAVTTLLSVALDVTAQVQARQQLADLAAARQALNETLEQQIAERTAALVESERQVRAMASRLTEAEHEERRRISQVLHDDLQQLLYGIQLKLNFACHAAPETEGMLQYVAQAEQLLDQSISITRQLTVDLNPPILKQEGLVDALAWLVKQMKELYHFRVTLVAEHTFLIPDENMRVLLFHIVRELLFNTVKHAQTDRATVELSKAAEGGLVIQVTDDGAGFDPAAVLTDNQGGYGLFSVRERLGLYGGHLVVTSALGAGTQITVHLPAHPAS